MTGHLQLRMVDTLRQGLVSLSMGSYFKAFPNSLNQLLFQPELYPIITVYADSNYSTTDYLYLLSYNEINSNGPDYRLTKILDYYKTTDNDRTKYFNGNSYGWWLRTVGSGIAFYLVNANGSLEGNVSYIGYGIAPAFRIA